MAYGLKYYKELTQPNGKVVRLEILEKGYEGASKEIGPVCQALRLDIQGDTEIDAPIVKTSLSMTFVDAPDHADARTKKCGNWDEFYTSDATLWRVVLKARNAQETAFTTMWGGYITPDSYTEVLQYRGSVTLVARDNIGHLSDFPFDAEGNADGMISLIELIRGAWDKIESPMTLDDQAVANADWMLSDGVYAYDTYMNVSAFEDMNWYDALESALYAYGLVLRYTGNNNVSFYSLRNLPRMGAHEVEDISFIEPTFMSGAERELTPAVKRIEEAVDYEIVEQKAAPLIESVTFTGASSTIPFESKNIFGEKEWKNIPTWPIDNTTNEGWGNDKSKTLFFSPKAYGNNSFGNELYIATNTDGSGSVWYGQHIQGKSFAFTLSFGQLIERIGSGGITPIYLLPITVKKVNVVISASANGVTSYLNAGGSWQTSEAVLSLDIDEEARTATKDIALGAFSLDESLVKITIKNITLGAKSGEEWWDTSTGLGIYVAINALTFTNSNGEPLCETNRVNTNYDAKNNIILSRDPKIAPALNDVLFPAIIKNGIFVKEGRTYNPAKTWYWGGQTPQQMAVYNHLQLLCYHAKPNNILRGTIVNADVTDMQVIWMWHGAEHMLVSGTLDLISGYIENAVLREFARYEDMWGMLEPADMPEVEGKSSTNVEGGVAASNEGARMTSTTTVNIGGGGGSIVLDTFMSDTSQNGVQNRVIKAYVDGLGDDITKAYNAAISALNAEITNALSGKVDNVTFNSLSTQVATNKTDIATNKTNIGKLDTRLTTAEGEIDTLQTYTNWLDSVKGLIYKEGDNIKINTSLIVVGDTSSGGSGQDTPASGTVTGIKVSASETLTPNNAGIIDMVSVLSSIDVSDQLKDYAKLTDIPSLDGYATETWVTNKNYLSSITKTMVDSVLGSTAAGNANRFLMSTGSTSVWAAISKDMVTSALGYTPANNASLANYLPLSGGTITTNSDGTTLVLYTPNHTWTGIRFKPSNSSIGATLAYSAEGFGVSDEGWKNFYTLIHSGNIGSYALKTDGSNAMEAGILWSDYSGFDETSMGLRTFMSHNGTSVDGIFPSTNYGTVLHVSINSSSYAFQLASSVNADGLFYRGYYADNKSWESWKTIAFTDSTVAAANKLATARTIWGQSFDGTGNVSGSLTGTNFLLMDRASNPYLKFTENGLNGFVQFWDGAIFIGPTTTKSLLVNNNGNVLIGTTTDSSSGKLQISGGATLDGYMAIGAVSKIADLGEKGLVVATSSDRSNWGMAMWTEGNGKGYIQQQAFTSAATTYSLCLNPFGGNVGIGTTSPQDKLDVNGTAKANAFRASVVCIECDSSGNTSGYGGEINRLGGGQLWIQAREGGLQLGNAASTTNFNGAVTMSSTLSVGNDVTLGASLFMGNNVGFFFKNTSNANVLAMHVDTSNVLQIAYNNVNSVAIQRDTHINGNLVVSGDIAVA